MLFGTLYVPSGSRVMNLITQTVTRVDRQTHKSTSSKCSQFNVVEVVGL